MGFRNPVESAIDPDTTPSVRFYDDPTSPFPRGVVEWSDGVGVPVTAAFSAVGTQDPTGAVTKYRPAWRINGPQAAGALSVALLTEDDTLSPDGIRGVLQLTADRLRFLGPVDTGDRVVNVKAFGATGDGVTDDGPAIAKALDISAEAGEVVFPPGTYLISAPIELRRNKTLRGVHAPRWAYDTGAPSRIKASPGFTGAALVIMRDEEAITGAVGAAANGQYTGPNDQCGMRLEKITLDGFNVAGGIDGILATGLVRDVRLNQVCVRRVTGTGVHTLPYRRLNGTNQYPRGWTLHQVVTDTCGNNGFGLNLLNDSTLTDCLAVASANHGFYLGGPGELQLVGCRSVFNKNGHGFYLNGQSYGNTVLSACSTDRNDLNGVYIDCTGSGPITLSGVMLRRDGGNDNAGGASLAGLAVANCTAPVTVDGIGVTTGVDDVGAGAWTPQHGIRVTNSRSVVVASGVLWGRDLAVSDGGGNTNYRISPQVVRATGTTTAPTFTYPTA